MGELEKKFNKAVKRDTKMRLDHAQKESKSLEDICSVLERPIFRLLNEEYCPAEINEHFADRFRDRYHFEISTGHAEMTVKKLVREGKALEIKHSYYNGDDWIVYRMYATRRCVKTWVANWSLEKIARDNFSVVAANGEEVSFDRAYSASNGLSKYFARI